MNKILFHLLILPLALAMPLTALEIFRDPLDWASGNNLNEGKNSQAGSAAPVSYTSLPMDAEPGQVTMTENGLLLSTTPDSPDPGVRTDHNFNLPGILKFSVEIEPATVFWGGIVVGCKPDDTSLWSNGGLGVRVYVSGAFSVIERGEEVRKGTVRAAKSYEIELEVKTPSAYDGSGQAEVRILINGEPVAFDDGGGPLLSTSGFKANHVILTASTYQPPALPSAVFRNFSVIQTGPPAAVVEPGTGDQAANIVLDADLDGYEVTLGEPVIVAQALLSVSGWGPYQFPDVEQLPGGKLRVSWHLGEDNASDHGKVRRAHAISEDMGKTWREVADPFAGLMLEGKPIHSPIAYQDKFGTLLPNGDYLTGALQPAQPFPEKALPPSAKPLTIWKQSHGNFYEFYDARDFPTEYAEWKMRRLPHGATEWVEEYATVNFPGQLRYALAGLLIYTYLDSPYAKKLDIAPDGAAWIAAYGHRMEDGRVWDSWGAMLLRSEDHGKTWNLAGQIPYEPTAEDKNDPAKWDGFSEPAITFFPDGSLFSVLRTCDVTAENRPLYWSRSTDQGKSWSQPRVFDRYGVWPNFVRLENGTTLLSFGRPGDFIRASRDPAGLKWSKKLTILDATSPGCSNAGIAPIGPDTALVVYSSFKHPQKDSAVNPAPLVKTILARTVTVRPKSGH